MESSVINPKCCKLGELYGESDPNTFEWSDGLIASTVRRFAKELSADTSGKVDKHATGDTSGAEAEVCISPAIQAEVCLSLIDGCI